MLMQNINVPCSTVIVQLVTELVGSFIIVCLCKLLCHLLSHKSETPVPIFVLLISYSL